MKTRRSEALCRGVVCAIAAATLVVGCGKEKKEPESAGAPQRIEFSKRDEIVSEEELNLDEKKQRVSADFDQDGLKDLALVEEEEEGRAEVGIYIRRMDALEEPERPMDPDAATPDAATQGDADGEGEQDEKSGKSTGVQYYRVGRIRDREEGQIVGVATRMGRLYTDLIILVAGTNATTQMVHYRNDGSGFEEVPILQTSVE